MFLDLEEEIGKFFKYSFKYFNKKNFQHFQKKKKILFKFLVLKKF